MIIKNKVYEGTLVVADWSGKNDINSLSLYTQDHEDIPLVHGLGSNNIRPYINQKVRVLGDVKTNNKGEKRISVKKIILRGFTKKRSPKFDEFGNIIVGSL